MLSLLSYPLTNWKLNWTSLAYQLKLLRTIMRSPAWTKARKARLWPPSEFNLRIRLEHRLLSELHQLVSECPCFFLSFPSNHCILRESARTLCALRKSACKVYLFSLITLLCQTISVKHCFASDDGGILMSDADNLTLYTEAKASV